MTEDDQHEPDDQPICLECIGDIFLRDEVSKTGRHERCAVCDATALCWRTRQYASRIQPLFQSRFISARPDYTMGEWLPAEGHSAAEIIQEMTKCGDDRTAELILESLREVWFWWPPDGEDDPLDDDLRFSPDRRASASSFLWTEIEEELRTRSRYFNPQIEERLREMFAGVDELVAPNGEKVIRRAGPGTELTRLWRMRIATDWPEVRDMLTNPAQKLGPPPSHLAGSGRMNPIGISIFYGAADVETCLGEVRAPVGAHGVAAAFEITRELQLLDIAALARVKARNISHFDPDYERKHERVAFLQRLSSALQVPVLPGEETSGYLPSQMVAEFLGSRNLPRIDGVIYPSIQAGGQGSNAVLFHHASVVEQLAPHKRLELRGPDWYDETFEIVEEGDPVDIAQPEEDPVLPDDEAKPIRPDDRVPALRVCTDSIVVVDVKAIQYEFVKQRVPWIRRVTVHDNLADGDTSTDT
jgi:RES domain-containing protein